jgi:hypothetical protein
MLYTLRCLDGLSTPHPAAARHSSHWIVLCSLGDLSLYFFTSFLSSQRPPDTVHSASILSSLPSLHT